jgi:SAM-dependent methyltransferase
MAEQGWTRRFRRRELQPVWADERAMIARYREIWDSSPVLRRFYHGIWRDAMAFLAEGPIVELGGGAGLIREAHPEVISSDILPYLWTNLVCDAARLPFADASVGGFMAIAFFHHCTAPRRLFEEVSRTLRPGGRMVIMDPYIAPLTGFILKMSTQEDLDFTEPPFEAEERAQTSPLLEANLARGTIVFERHRDAFEVAFPSLRILEVQLFNKFTALVAGSFNQKSPFPSWLYPLVDGCDRVLHPVRRLTAMSMSIVLEKR